MSYARPLIERLTAYTPGEQPAGQSKVAKLNTNENPYPPAPAVMAAIHAVTPEVLRRYPSPSAAGFRQVAAALHHVYPEQVLATNGGDELLRMLIQVFAEPGTPIGLTEPTYTLYSVLAAAHGAGTHAVSRGDDWSLPQQLAQQWNTAGCRLAFIVNPHAPTGRFETPQALKAVAKAFNGVLVIDEAYVDFAPDSCLTLVQGAEALPNVILLRSLSKGYGLAGLRFGYGLGPVELIAAMHKVRDSYNCDVLAQAAAEAALAAQDYYTPIRERVKAERRRLTDELRRRGLKVPDSHTNFVLAELPEEYPLEAPDIYAGLKTRGVLIRYFNQPRLENKLRISVGSAEENTRLLAEWDDLVSGSSGAFTLESVS